MADPGSPLVSLAPPAVRGAGPAGARGAAALPARPDPARQAAEEFEAFFLSQVLQQMVAGIATDGPFGGGHAENVWRAMMNDELAQGMARAGGVGIADAVYQEILKLQEVV